MSIMKRKDKYDIYYDMQKLVREGNLKKLSWYFWPAYRAQEHAKIYEDRGNLMRDAVANHHFNIVEFLINKKVGDEQEGLRQACMRNDKKIMDFFWARGITLNPDDDAVLQKVMENGNVELFKELLDKGMSPQSENCFALIAEYERYNEYADILIAHGAEPQRLPNVTRMLQEAARKENYSFLDTLITLGADGNNAGIISYLADKGNSRAVLIYDALLERGATPETLSYPGHGTLLHLAVSKRHPWLFDKIFHYVESGAIDINALNSHNENALMALVKQDTCALELVRMAEQLLGAGIDINTVNTTKQTALHLAVKNGDLSIVKLLARKDANLTLEDNDGHTPLSLAQKKEDVAITAFLKTAGNRQENWQRLDDISIARIAVHPVIQKKITEIFNFESHERLTLIDDLSPDRPSTSLRESFDAIKSHVLEKAFARYKDQHGPLDIAQALQRFNKDILSFPPKGF